MSAALMAAAVFLATTTFPVETGVHRGSVHADRLGIFRDDHDDLGDSPGAGDVPDLAPWTATARITAYAPGCGDSGRGTRAGTRPRWGVVATDRNVIPAWSLIEIEGFPETVFRSEDTGSGVRGWHLDVWMPSCAEARRWGAPTRAIRVVRWGA